MEKMVDYLDGANKHKNSKQQLAKSVINNLRKYMGVVKNFTVVDEDGKQLTDEGLEKLEVQVIDFYEEDEKDN